MLISSGVFYMLSQLQLFFKKAVLVSCVFCFRNPISGDPTIALLYIPFSMTCFIVLLMTSFLVYLILQRLDKEGVSFCTRTTYDDNAITNALEIYDSPR